MRPLRPHIHCTWHVLAGMLSCCRAGWKCLATRMSIHSENSIPWLLLGREKASMVVPSREEPPLGKRTFSMAPELKDVWLKDRERAESSANTASIPQIQLALKQVAPQGQWDVCAGLRPKYWNQKDDQGSVKRHHLQTTKEREGSQGMHSLSCLAPARGTQHHSRSNPNQDHVNSRTASSDHGRYVRFADHVGRSKTLAKVRRPLRQRFLQLPRM